MMGEDKRLFRNALPGDAGASPEQTVWFKNQNSFEKEEILAMVDYKRTVLKVSEDGLYSKNQSRSYCVCRDCNHERGDDIHG